MIGANYPNYWSSAQHNSPLFYDDADSRSHDVHSPVAGPGGTHTVGKSILHLGRTGSSEKSTWTIQFRYMRLVISSLNKSEQGSMLTGKINEQQTTLSASTRHRLDLTVGEQLLFFVVAAVPGRVFFWCFFGRGSFFVCFFSLWNKHITRKTRGGGRRKTINTARRKTINTARKETINTSQRKGRK